MPKKTKKKKNTRQHKKKKKKKAPRGGTKLFIGLGLYFLDLVAGNLYNGENATEIVAQSLSH